MSGAAFSIRRATPDDLAEAAALFERVAALAMPWLPGRVRDAAAFLAAAAEEMVWIAETGGRIVGLAALYAPEAFLHALYVAPEMQGRGVGQALLLTAAGSASAPLGLKVEDRNLAARRFYARAGFAETERGEANGSAWIRLAQRGLSEN